MKREHTKVCNKLPHHLSFYCSVRLCFAGGGILYVLTPAPITHGSMTSKTGMVQVIGQKHMEGNMFPIPVLQFELYLKKTIVYTYYLSPQYKVFN